MVRESDRIDLTFPASRSSRPDLDRLRTIRATDGSYGGSGLGKLRRDLLQRLRSLSVDFVGRGARSPAASAVVVVGNSPAAGRRAEDRTSTSARSASCTAWCCEDIHIVREKRVGSSIVNTGLANRRGPKVRLYDAATVLRKPA